MTINRYGDFVKYEDHLEAVEDLEYLVRTLNEESMSLQDEVNYWKEKYFEYYERDQL